MSLLEPAHKPVAVDGGPASQSCDKCGTYACVCNRYAESPKGSVVPESVWTALRSGLKSIQELSSAYWSANFYVPPGQMHAAQARIRKEGLRQYIKRVHGDLHQAMVDLSAAEGLRAPVSPYEFDGTWLLEPVYEVDQHHLDFAAGDVVPLVPSLPPAVSDETTSENDAFTPEDISRLARFAQAAMQSWAEARSMSAEDLQLIGERYGLLQRQKRGESSLTECQCASEAGSPSTELALADLYRKCDRLGESSPSAVVVSQGENTNRVLTDGAISAIADVIHTRITVEGGYRNGMLKETLNSVLRGTELPMDYSHEGSPPRLTPLQTVKLPAINDDELFRPSDILAGHTVACNLSHADPREWSKGCSCELLLGTSVDNSDTERLAVLCERGWMLRCFPAIGADCKPTTGWQVLGQTMDRKGFLLIAEVYKDDPRAAIDKARTTTNPLPRALIQG